MFKGLNIVFSQIHLLSENRKTVSTFSLQTAVTSTQWLCLYRVNTSIQPEVG